MSRALPVTLAAALVALPGAHGGAAKEPGLTATSVLVGGTVPLSGPEVAYAPVARGAEAYFKYVNSRGSVHGRKIRYRYLDDAYDPSQTIQQTRQLVQQEGVFAIFNSVGTEHALAVRPYLNGVKVPQLFVGSGSSAIGRGYRRFPWTMGYLPSFRGEASIYGREVARTLPRARVGVLHEDSEYGRDMLAGLRQGMGRRAGQIVEVETYEVTDAEMGSQVGRLKAARANVFMLFALPKQTIQAFVAAYKLGWRPKVYVNSVSVDPFVMNVARQNTRNRLTQGAITTAFLRDPTDPALAKDSGVRLYKRIMRRYLPGHENELAHVYGMAVAHTMVTTLRQAGKALNRGRLMNAATHLTERDNPFLARGVVVHTSPTNYFPIARTRLLRYDRGRWKPFGGFVNVP